MLASFLKGGGTLDQIRPEVHVEESTPSYGKVVVEPLERGYGVTLGNALRRVLLSSIKGAAITAVRIDGVLHEYSTIPGVREDVIELLMNLKHIPVRSHSQEVRMLRLEAEGPKTVTVADIQPDSEIEFVDKTVPICTLAGGARISMDLFVEMGAGYATLDRPRPSYLPIDALLIDALYSPVLRVSYVVENCRVGQRTDYDRLSLEVWTNGVVSPRDAVSEAAGILDFYFSLTVRELAATKETQESLETSAQEMISSETQEKNDGESPLQPKVESAILSRPVRDLELSVRSENCLLRGGVHVIGDLVGRSREDLLKIRNLGKISLREIEEKLGKFGLTLGSSAPKNDGKGTKEE